MANRKRNKNPKRLKPVVGKVWPRIRRATEQGSSRYEITRLLLLICAVILVMLTVDAIVRDNQNILGEILSLVRNLLLAFGGWALGRSMS
jgi:hypothetical protein